MEFYSSLSATYLQADDNTVDIITLHFGLSCWTSYVFTREYQEAPHMCIILQ